MKKEVFIAIIIGFVIGLLITFGVFTAQQSLKHPRLPNQVASDSTDTPATPALLKSQNLTISGPENGQLITKDSVTVTGSTLPGALVAIISNRDSTTTPADGQGNFSGELSLSEGVNEITVKTYDQTGTESQQNLTVIYIPKTNSQEATPSPTLKIKPTSI